MVTYSVFVILPMNGFDDICENQPRSVNRQRHEIVAANVIQSTSTNDGCTYARSFGCCVGSFLFGGTGALEDFSAHFIRLPSYEVMHLDGCRKGLTMLRTL